MYNGSTKNQGGRFMQRIAICDDEPVMCEQLKQMLTAILTSWKLPFSVTCFTDPLQMLSSSLDFTMIFLDIQMPRINGLELAQRLRSKSSTCALFFVTVSKDYMPDAFELEPVDYLCKPVDGIRLERSLKRALIRLEHETEKALLIQSANRCRSVRLSSIYCCEIINRKIYLYTGEGTLDYYGKITDLEKQLDKRFFRCHRSYLINLDYFLEFSNGQITLENQMKIPLSRLRRQEFLQTMVEYLEKEG